MSGRRIFTIIVVSGSVMLIAALAKNLVLKKLKPSPTQVKADSDARHKSSEAKVWPDTLNPITVAQPVLVEGGSDEEDTTDPDFIKIPFLLILSSGNMELLIEEAEDYISEYPDSPIGYHFLAQGLWRSGEKEEALGVIRSAIRNDAGNESMLDMLRKTVNKPVIDYPREIGMNTLVLSKSREG